MTRAKKQVEDVVVRITKLAIVEESGSTKARFDFAIKAGGLAVESRGYRLTESMFEKKVRPYSTKFQGSNGQDVWHDKGKINTALEHKLIAEVERAIEFARDNEKTTLKLDECMAMYE